MILQHFSWQELLVVILVFSIAWYVAVLLLFYRRDLFAFFNSKMMVTSIPSQRSTGADKNISASPADMDRADNREVEVMGKSRLPEGMSIISADLIRFSDQVIPISAG